MGVFVLPFRSVLSVALFFFFFNDTATTEIYTLSLHDALPICDYLARKQVLSHGLRFSPAGTLAVPMLDAVGAIHGLQLIYPASHPRRKRRSEERRVGKEC